MDTDPRYQQVIDLQIQLEEIEGVAKLAAETCDDAPFAGTLGVIERRAAAIRAGMDALLPTDTKPAGNGHDAAGLAEAEDEDAFDKELWRYGLTGIAPKSAEDSRRLCVVVFSKILGQCAALSPRVIAEKLDQYEWESMENLAIDPDDPNRDHYTVRKSWTLRGMKSFLATLEFMEWIEFGLRDDGETEFTYPADW